jgi:hypothetical protein
MSPKFFAATRALFLCVCAYPAFAANTVTANLTASANPVVSGTPETVTWTSTNATSCSLTNGSKAAQTVATSGRLSTGSFLVTTTYTLSCTGATGTSSPAVLTVVATAQGSGGAGTLSLSAANYSVAAASGGLTISVNRAAGSSGAVSVGYGTANGTAIAGTDYTAASGVLNWAAGDTAAKSFIVTVNKTVSVAKSFTVAISAPAGGASLGSPSTATVAVTPAAPTGAVTASLTASANPVVSGTPETVSWSSANATSCSLQNGTKAAATVATSGKLSTGSFTVTTTYTLICTGSSGTSSPAVLTVTVASAGSATLSPEAVALTPTRSQQFSATLPGTAVTWAVNGVVGGSSATGTVSSTGLYTAGTAPGRFTVTATSATDTTKSATATVAVTDLAGIYSYHDDLSRDGSNVKEYALTKANVASGFGKLASCKADGAVVAQPLWVANVSIAGAKHNVVYAATEHDGLFAFDADPVNGNCTTLWSKNLIDTAHGANAGETTIPTGPGIFYVGGGAGDIEPEIGITGTPVIDPATNILYVVSKSFDSTKTVYYQRLHAIDITTGLEKANSPILITGSYTPPGGTTVTFDTRHHLQRAGLTFANGNVYVAFTAHEDASLWYGWMMSYQYSAAGFIQKNVINVSPVSAHGGIWMSGGAPAADDAGNVFFLTGNGTFNAMSGGADHGNTMMKLSPTLGIEGYYTPSTEVANDSVDQDLGAGGAAILADLPEGNTVRHAMIFGGKESTLFVVDRDNPGGYDANNSLRIQSIAFGNSIFATGALWNNNFYGSSGLSVGKS